MENRTLPIEVLERLITNAIVEIGIGGYVSVSDIARTFNPISAVEFAQIVYATDQMKGFVIAEGIPDLEKAKESSQVENITPLIEQNQFEDRPHFKHLTDLFEVEVGQQVRAEFR